MVDPFLTDVWKQKLVPDLIAISEFIILKVIDSSFYVSFLFQF